MLEEDEITETSLCSVGTEHGQHIFLCTYTYDLSAYEEE
jgi:hypothetical protein